MIFERNRVEIDLDNFAHNIGQLKSFLPAGTGFMQIVKADAYGHGAFEIAKKSIELGAGYLGVANVEEGILLRSQNIKIPILVLSPCFVAEIETLLEYDLTPAVSSYDFAAELNNQATSPRKIHIEVDTGMGRSGFHYTTALSDILNIHRLENLEMEGIFSHYSSSENDAAFTLLQNQRFSNIIDALGFEVKYLHITNSAGVITNSKQKEAPQKMWQSANRFNLVRLGLLSYGIYPDPSYQEIIDLRPVMSFKSMVCQINKALQGDTVGYNRSFIAKRDTRYAVIPVGYADGYDVLLSDKGYVRIKGHTCPVIGRVSMDMVSVDITDFPDVAVGNEVLLIDDNELRAETLSALFNGLSYELLAQIGRRARRYYKENGSVISDSPLPRREFVSQDFSDKKLNLIIASAISQRLQSKEIAALLYGEVLRRFFSDKDRDIHYRKNFLHTIEFKTIEHNPGYFEVTTTLSFTKILQQDYFFVACATRMEELERYFQRRDVEYRWLLDSNFSLTEDSFKVSKVSINGEELEVSANPSVSAGRNSLEIRCSKPFLQDLTGKEVLFSISTKTYYPRHSNQLAIYITELTKGVGVEFRYPPGLFRNVEVVTIFSGQSKYPQTTKKDNTIEVISEPEEWIFPNSGVVFTYAER